MKYGYAMVARIEEGRAALKGRLAFALYPHQTVFNLPEQNIVLLPQSLPPERAVLGANMETALNAVWDAAPGPADRIAVVGAGVLGLLVARLCVGMRADVTVVDTNPERADVAGKLGATFAKPDKAPENCDLVVHTSASAAGLATALRLAGDEATVLELSWYGSDEVKVPLGGCLSFAAAEAHFQPGRKGVAVASPALGLSPPSFRRARPLERSGAGRLAGAGYRVRRSAGQAPLDILHAAERAACPLAAIHRLNP